MSGPGKSGPDTKYRPEFCEWLIEHQSKGLSFVSFIAWLYREKKIKVSRASIFNWKNEKHDNYQPDWAEAFDIAQACCALYWEELANDGIWNTSTRNADGSTESRSLNTGIYAINVRNKLNWNDRASVKAELGSGENKITLSYNLDDDKDEAPSEGQ